MGCSEQSNTSRPAECRESEVPPSFSDARRSNQHGALEYKSAKAGQHLPHCFTARCSGDFQRHGLLKAFESKQAS